MLTHTRNCPTHFHWHAGAREKERAFITGFSLSLSFLPSPVPPLRLRTDVKTEMERERRERGEKVLAAPFLLLLLPSSLGPPACECMGGRLETGWRRRGTNREGHAELEMYCTVEDHCLNWRYLSVKKAQFQSNPPGSCLKFSTLLRNG